VRLRLESREPEIHALPWEITFHADPRLGFLSRNPDFTLLRRWGPADETPLVLPGGPLRILLFIASPADLDPEKSRLDFETEENFLFAQLDAALGRGEVEIDVAEDGTLETLQARLESNVYHVVHCSMHGSMKDGAAILSCEDHATGLQRKVTPDELLEVWKKGKSRVPGFFLSACQSAQPDTEAAVPDFTRALLAAGVPHVIGMRRSVADSAATHFAGHFYHALAAGKPIDRAVTEARQNVTGAASAGAKGPHELFIELFQQWSIPVLYSRKPEPAVLDSRQPFQPQPRVMQKKVQIGELALTQEGFIGRRAAIRRHYRKWASGETRHLLLYGLGGVGKTALAGHFSLRLRRENPALQIFAFAPPFDLAAMEEQLRPAFLQAAGKKALENWQILAQPLDRLEVMLGSLAAAGPTVFIFDNLETSLDLATRTFLPEQAATLRLIAAAQKLAEPVWTLLTCRYAIAGGKLPHTTVEKLPEASLGDILRFMRQWPWPETVQPGQKAEMYQTLGGNFRSIEWLSGLLTQPAQRWPKLQQKFAGLHPSADTPQAALQTVAEAMRRDLLFDELLALLTPAEKLLVQRLTLEPRPLIIDGLYALWDETDNLENAITHLTDYCLLETAYSFEVALPTYQVPPLVAELLNRAPLSEALQRDTHARLGRYWRFAGEKFTRLISDDLAAFEHFTLGGLSEEAEVMLEGLSGAFYRWQQFGRVVAFLMPFVQRRGETAPWWALNRLGISFHHLGQIELAFQCFLQAEKVLQHPKSKEEKQQLGTTLNNLSQVFKARGDYGKALEYLEKSLAIRREIGDRAGEGTTLNNISQIYDARGDYGKALEYLEKSLAIQREIGDRAGEGTTLNNISQIYDARGDYGKALEYLEKSLAIRREIGDRAGMISTLHNMAYIYQGENKLQEALEYFKEALLISIETNRLYDIFDESRDLGALLCHSGDKKQGLSLLQQALEVGQQIGPPALSQVEALLQEFS